jgi:hypothetical protein
MTNNELEGIIIDCISGVAEYQQLLRNTVANATVDVVADGLGLITSRLLLVGKELQLRQKRAEERRQT